MNDVHVPQEGVPEKPVARVDLIQKMVELLHRSFHYASERDKSAQTTHPIVALNPSHAPTVLDGNAWRLPAKIRWIDNKFFVLCRDAEHKTDDNIVVALHLPPSV